MVIWDKLVYHIPSTFVLFLTQPQPFATVPKYLVTNQIALHFEFDCRIGLLMVPGTAA